MTLPYELLWGVDVAVKKLRPGAEFQLEGTSITFWKDSNGSQPPTWDEINNQIFQDQSAAKKWAEENNEDFVFENIQPIPPSDDKKYFWNEEEKVWEQEPDYDVE